LIQLNYRDAKPIYEQIKDGLRKLVITNSLIANEKLPSVRGARGGEPPAYRPPDNQNARNHTVAAGVGGVGAGRRETRTEKENP